LVRTSAFLLNNK